MTLIFTGNVGTGENLQQGKLFGINYKNYEVEVLLMTGSFYCLVEE